MRPRDIKIIKKRNNPSYVLKHFFIETIEKNMGFILNSKVIWMSSRGLTFWSIMK